MCATSPGVAVILISTRKLTIRSSKFSQVREPVKYLCRVKSDKVVSHELHDFSRSTSKYLRHELARHKRTSAHVVLFNYRCQGQKQGGTLLVQQGKRVANFDFFSFHRLFQVLESVYTSTPFLGLTRNVSNNVFLRIMYERAHAATLRWKFYLLQDSLAQNKH